MAALIWINGDGLTQINDSLALVLPGATLDAKEDAMLVADLMTSNVVSVLPETTLADAARIMLARHVSGLPVVDRSEKLVGMVTEGDLLRRTELGTEGEEPSWLKAFLMPSSLAQDYVHSHGRHVSEVMSTHPLSVSPDAPIREATELMRRKHIKRLPVLHEGKLVGVISRADLLTALARKLIATTEKCSEQEIGDHILAEIKRQRWAPKSGIRVSVNGNVVDLEGVIFSDAERQAVRVIAENAPGVKEVHDNMVYIDPGSGMSIPAG